MILKNYAHTCSTQHKKQIVNLPKPTQCQHIITYRTIKNADPSHEEPASP